MRRKISIFLVLSLIAALFTGCKASDDAAAAGSATAVLQPPPVVLPEPEEVNYNDLLTDQYISELTGLPIPIELKDQRPVAVMVDNEVTALDHYETAECDIVYELMNSTANNLITRLMCIRKDWKSIQRMGSIRSTRPSNIILASEYDAVLVHDGGPYHNDQWLAKPWNHNLSGGFARIDNGKPSEFTEYITTGELEQRMAAAGFSETYDEYRPDRDTHFIFANPGTDAKPSDYGLSATPGTYVEMHFFFHNDSELRFNEQTGTYDYYEYGKLHTDAEDGEPLTFKNLIVICITFQELDGSGYLKYDLVNSKEFPGIGYYVTNGEKTPITWVKESDTDIMKFYDENGEEIVMNPGKTYIGLMPYEGWNTLQINDGVSGLSVTDEKKQAQ